VWRGSERDMAGRWLVYGVFILFFFFGTNAIHARGVGDGGIYVTGRVGFKTDWLWERGRRGLTGQGR
jgi:hypothetical protein